MDTLRSLLAGNRDHVRDVAGGFTDLQDGQLPDAVTVCCADSRVLQEAMWGDLAPGDVFTVGNIGNRVLQRGPDGGTVVSGDVLYPLVHTGTRTAVVVGHTGCGAVTAAYRAVTGADRENGNADPEEDGGDDDGAADQPPGIRACLDLLEPGVRTGVEALPGDLADAEAINRLVEHNVDRQVAALCESPSVPDGTTVAGVVYDFQDVYSGERGRLHLVNLDGTRDPGTLRETHPDVADRVSRLWLP